MTKLDLWEEAGRQATCQITNIIYIHIGRWGHMERDGEQHLLGCVRHPDYTGRLITRKNEKAKQKILKTWREGDL